MSKLDDKDVLDKHGKFSYDVQKFAENEDYTGLKEYVQNRIKVDGEKDKQTTKEIVTNAIEEKFGEFLKELPVDRKEINQEKEQEKPDGKGGFKSAGDFILAVTKEGFYNQNPSDVRLKALTEGTGADGGYTVPEDFYSMMEKDHMENAVIRQAGATVIPTAGDALNIPIPNDSDRSSYLYGGMIAYWKSEAAALTETSAKINNLRIPVEKLTGFTYISNELLEDNAVGMGTWITSKWGKGMAWYEDESFIGGTGVGQPFGIVNSGALISTTRSAASAFALSDAADHLSRLYATSLGSACWILNPIMLTKLIQMASSSVVWIDQNQGANKALPSANLFGMPIYFSEHNPALNTAGDSLLIDPSYYVIADKPGVRVAVSTEYRFANDQTTYRIIKRVGGQPAVDSTTTRANSTTTSPFVTSAAG